jgi:uncharacterized protein YfbU (UPF0304 family)
MELSKKERWFLSNQYRILEKLYPNKADYYTQCREIVDKGYELEYDLITDYIHEPMTSEVCTEVSDILEMYNSLQLGYDALEDKEGIEESGINFQGFDGNNESEQLHYAQFLINKQGRLQDLKHTDGLNTHMPYIGYYRRMLEEWNKSSDKYNLTKADIVRITSP